VYIVTGPRLPRVIVTDAAVARLTRAEGAVLPAVLALLDGESIPRLRVVRGESGIVVGTLDDFGRDAA
jgi:hypothetical protein